MLIQQLSVFLENRSDRLSEVTEILSNQKINISALSMAEASDYSVVRLILSDSDKAAKALKERHFAISITSVICFATPNQPGALQQALTLLTQHGIGIEYLYAFAFNEKALVALRTDKIEQSVAVLQSHRLQLLKLNELYEL
jgi:hypothetical protein